MYIQYKEGGQRPYRILTLLVSFGESIFSFFPCIRNLDGVYYSNKQHVIDIDPIVHVSLKMVSLSSFCEAPST